MNDLALIALGWSLGVGMFTKDLARAELYQFVGWIVWALVTIIGGMVDGTTTNLGLGFGVVFLVISVTMFVRALLGRGRVGHLFSCKHCRENVDVIAVACNACSERRARNADVSK